MTQLTKKMLAVMLAAVFSLSACIFAPATASAADSGFVIKDGILVEYNGNAADVVVPDGVVGSNQTYSKTTHS